MVEKLLGIIVLYRWFFSLALIVKTSRLNINITQLITLNEQSYSGLSKKFIPLSMNFLDYQCDIKTKNKVIAILWWFQFATDTSTIKIPKHNLVDFWTKRMRAPDISYGVADTSLRECATRRSTRKRRSRSIWRHPQTEILSLFETSF